MLVAVSCQQLRRRSFLFALLLSVGSNGANITQAALRILRHES